MVFVHAINYAASFLVIWLGARLIVGSVSKLAKSSHSSSFSLSFLLLGLLTSIPELAVGLNAIAHNDPEIFSGNLLGGIVVIFLLIIPILAILGKGITIDRQISNGLTLVILAVIALPALLILDKRLTNFEALFMVGAYLVVAYSLARKTIPMDHRKRRTLLPKFNGKDLLAIISGVLMVLISSHLIVQETLYFSELLHISLFIVSLLLLSVGTNVPELSLAVQSILSGKKDVAFGDYMGSAAANTLLFGIFTLLTSGDVLTSNNYLRTSFFLILGLVLFYIFSRSNKTLSRLEGLVMLLVYLLFLFAEVVIK